MKRFLPFLLGLLCGACLLGPIVAGPTVVIYDDVSLLAEINQRVNINLTNMRVIGTSSATLYAMGYTQGAGDVVAMMHRYGWFPFVDNPPPPPPNPSTP